MACKQAFMSVAEYYVRFNLVQRIKAEMHLINGWNQKQELEIFSKLDSAEMHSVQYRIVSFPKSLKE